VRKFARIVLRRFKINYTFVPYEDLMQLAFLCFFKIAPVYKEGTGSLEGYFIYSFTNEVSEFVKSSTFIRYRNSNYIPDDAQNPLDRLIFDELSKEIEDLLSSEELYVLNTYLKEGVFDLAYIAEKEDTTEKSVEWTIATIRDKITKYLDKEYDHYKGK
jgi:DNA-directed RNA polymerase specialized sigma24 family protein